MSDIPDLLAPPPSKSGFAARIMSKYGWTKGSGLGAEGAGITTALRVQVEKRRRRADADGGGFAEPGGRGKIIAPRELGKRRQDNNGGEQQDEEEEGGGQGKMSQVVVLRGMLEGMDDLRAEVEDGLGQEIGEECGEKYGRVERVYVDVEGGRRVYIKFTDAVSALRAVNALEGRVFNGNVIRPAFYDAERFERGEYEVGP
jgi:splicing factor 45